MRLNKTDANLLSRAEDGGLRCRHMCPVPTGCRRGNKHVTRLVGAGLLVADPYGPNDVVSHIISDAGRAALKELKEQEALQRALAEGGA